LNFYKDKVDVRAFFVQYNKDLEIEALRSIPVVFPKVEPKGIFLLLLSYPTEKRIVSNNKFFIYCASSSDDIFKKITSIKKKDGLKGILPDQRFNELRIISDIPIVSSLPLLGRVKDELIKFGGTEIGFNKVNGDSCLIEFEENPTEKKWFWNMVFELRWGG
jgi:hypothetical protein